MWSRDGRDLLFQALDGRVMAAGYTAKGDSFAALRSQLRLTFLLNFFDELRRKVPVWR